MASSDDLGRPRGCTYYRVRRVARSLGRHYDAYLARAGLKTTQYSLLSALRASGPVRLGELARVLSMDASTLSRNLRPLQERDWIRIETREDARARFAVLTPAGRAARKLGKAQWKAAQIALNETLGGSRVAEINALLDDSALAIDALADASLRRPLPRER